MRIAVFTDTYRPAPSGLVRVVGHLVEHARREGHEIALVTPALPWPPEPAVRHHIRLTGLTFPVYPKLTLCPPWLHGAGRRRLRDFEPDLVHVMTEAPVGWIGRRWARSRGIPLVTTYSTHLAHYAESYGLGALEGPVWACLRRFHRAADLTLTPSRAAMRELVDRSFHPRLRVWTRGIDAEAFKPDHRNPALRREMAGDADVVLLYVGRLAPEKGVGLLLDALPGIRRRAGREVVLVVVGDGPVRSELEARAVEGVRFTGTRNGGLLSATYASADVFVFPSEHEAFGQVVAEASASGLPVVAPDRGAVAELVSPGRTGTLFATGEVEALVEATVPLVRDDLLRWRMAANARSDAELRSWSDAFHRLFRLYEEAIESRDVTVSGPTRAGAGDLPILKAYGATSGLRPRGMRGPPDRLDGTAEAGGLEP